MKTLAALLLITVGVYANPVLENIGANNQVQEIDPQRRVAGAIESAIKDLSEHIKESGLDPYHIDRREKNYQLPVPVLFSFAGVVEDFLFTGLSNIVIHNIRYGVLTNRLTFDLELPRIQVSVKEASSNLVVFGNRFSSYVSGDVALVSVRIRGNMRVYYGLITGISVRSINVNCVIRSVESNLIVTHNDVDYSREFNDFFEITVLQHLHDYSREIDQLIEIFLWDLVKDL